MSLPIKEHKACADETAKPLCRADPHTPPTLPTASPLTPSPIELSS